MAEEPEVEAFEEEAPEKKPGIILPIVLALLAAGGGGALGMTVLGPAVAPTLAARALDGGGKQGGGGHGGGGHGGEPAATLHVLENLVVNPAGSDGTRYLLLSVAIEPEDQDHVEEVAAMEVALRHVLLGTLAARSVEDLSEISNRDRIIREIRDALESVVGEGSIHRIYLPQYVIQ